MLDTLQEEIRKLGGTKRMSLPWQWTHYYLTEQNAPCTRSSITHTHLWAQPNFAYILLNSFLSSVPLCECFQAVSATIPAVLSSPWAFWLLVSKSYTFCRRALWGVQLIGLERENFDWMSRSTPLNASARRENFIDSYAVCSLLCYQCNGFLCPCVCECVCR